MIESFLYNFSILHNINYESINNPNLLYYNQLGNLQPVPYGKALIDSFTLTIPLDLIEVLDKTLLEPAHYYYPKLQAVNISDPLYSDVKISDNGIKTRYKRFTRIYFDEKTNEKRNREVFCFVITAKMLGYQYLDGLRSDNIHLVLDYLNSQGIVKIQPEVFYNESRVSDIDIAVNYWFSSKVVWSNFLRCLTQRITLNKKFVKLFDDPGSMGLNINSREGARPSTPFVKFYHKGIELCQPKSMDFTNTFLLPQITDNLDHFTRWEVTVKDSKHRLKIKKATGITVGTRLSQLFELSELQLFEIHKHCLRCYVDKPAVVKNDSLTPIDDFIVNLINVAINLGADIQTIYDCVNYQGKNADVTKVTNARTRKKLKTLLAPITEYHYTSAIGRKLQQNQEINFFINQIIN